MYIYNNKYLILCHNLCTYNLRIAMNSTIMYNVCVIYHYEHKSRVHTIKCTCITFMFIISQYSGILTGIASSWRNSTSNNTVSLSCYIVYIIIITCSNYMYMYTFTSSPSFIRYSRFSIRALCSFFLRIKPNTSVSPNLQWGSEKFKMGIKNCM